MLFKRCCLLLTICLSSLGLVAQKSFSTKSVSIFKDQTSFFVKSGAVDTKDKSWFIQGDNIPQALNGTLWISSPTNDMQMVKAYQKTTKIPQQGIAQNYMEMIALNDGKKATLHLVDTSYKGTILVMKKDTEQEAIANGAAPSLNAPLFILQQASGSSIIFTARHIAQLDRLEFEKTPSYAYHYKSEETKPTLQVDFKSTNAKQSLDMMYLRKGLAWKPDYLIEMTSNKEAQLTLRTTLINNAEDMNTQELNLVAGVPNFRYANGVSDFLNFLYNPTVIQATPTRQPQRFVQTPTTSNLTINPSSILSNSVQIESVNFNNNNVVTPQNPTLEEVDNFDNGASLEDLYFYTVKDVQLKKGESALVDIFQIKVPLEHVYRASFQPNNINYNAGKYNYAGHSSAVNHIIKLKNNSAYTWTAAPALVVKNEDRQTAPISQDKLAYTSKGNYMEINLTEAPDVNIKFTEEEKSRVHKKRARKRGSYSYYNDLVTVETEITIQNFKDKKINFEIMRLINGQLIRTSTPWDKAVKTAPSPKENAMTNVRWKFDLEAGGTKVIKYSYSYLTSDYN